VEREGKLTVMVPFDTCLSVIG